MTNFKETKEAIMFANEYIVSGGFFNSIVLTAHPLNSGYCSVSTPTVDIVEHLHTWSATPIAQERTRLFYLFGDFGAGKSSVCKTLIKRLYDDYELSRYTDTIAKPILPIYFNLNALTGIYGSVEFANKSLAELLEVMFCFTGIPPIDGNDIIKLVRQYPCVVVFDGFDEAVQKLGKNQQNGFLAKLLSILPDAQYERDLMRIIGHPVEESTIPDSHSRIIISCRKQLFESQQEQTTFSESFYSTELSINGIHNYQSYQLDNLDLTTTKIAFRDYFHHLKQQEKKRQLEQQRIAEAEQYFVEYLAEHGGDDDDISADNAPAAEAPAQNEQLLDLQNEEVQAFLDYLYKLSVNPLLLSLAKSLLPAVKASLDKTGTINSVQMFSDLISRLMQRDSKKSVINIKEKQKILGALALNMWQQRSSYVSLENLRSFFFTEYKLHRQLQTGIDTGRIEIEIAFQDLHSSIIVRDDSDMYAFCQPLIFDYFLAVGIFESVLAGKHEIADFVFLAVSHTDTPIDRLDIDSLIFISHMLFSLLMRRDSISYDKFYNNWLIACNKLAHLETDAVMSAHDNKNADVNNDNDANHNPNINSILEAKAQQMWEVVTGEVMPQVT